MIAAAGRGERLGRSENKAFVALGGRPLVQHSLEVLQAHPEISGVVLVVAASDVERARAAFLSRPAPASLFIVAGGAQRADSVEAGLREVPPSCDTVLIHDGARPFLAPSLVTRCLRAAERHSAVIAAVPAADTVKEVSDGGVVSATLDRSRIWLAQTPQVFDRALLQEAHARARAGGISATDDASLVEKMGSPVHVVPGDPGNFKITCPEDLERAEKIVSAGGHAAERGSLVRTGIGYDAHRFTEARTLVLGGVRFEGEPGLLGHSDADVLCHAICDALLGAAGAGDIGRHFPDTDPRYEGVSSLSLLSQTAAMVREAGWRIVNVDAVVIAEKPRIAPRIADMRRALAQAMEIAETQVNVKGKTTEGMGFTGRGEGIAAQAVCAIAALP